MKDGPWIGANRHALTVYEGMSMVFILDWAHFTVTLQKGNGLEVSFCALMCQLPMVPASVAFSLHRLA